MVDWIQINIIALIFIVFVLVLSKKSLRRKYGWDKKNLISDAFNSKLNSQLESQLKNNAQKALDAIDSKCTLTASYKRADQGQHVFNKELLGFHRSVLEVLLEDVGGYEQLENLELDLKIPLSQPVKDAISKMKAKFGSDKNDFYVDFNAFLFGDYVRELRKALVAYLKADTSPNENDGNGIQETLQRVELIADQMVNHEVYVDPMARDRWLKEHQNHAKYNLVIDALRSGPMFRNILQAFQEVSRKIRVFRRTNIWEG